MPVPVLAEAEARWTYPSRGCSSPRLASCHGEFVLADMQQFTLSE